MHRALALAVLAALAVVPQSGAAPGTPAQQLGFPTVPDGPVAGYLMIADRDNNRIIIVSPTTKRVVWSYSLPEPDDAFFTKGYKTITTNQEFNQTIEEISVRAHRIVWSYGHAGVRGSSPGYLNAPDDTYLLSNGLFVVSDIQNCRVIWINRAHRIVRSIGHAGSCVHDPPRSLSSPNGDTPLPDGGVLVTEIGGWVDRFDKNGRLLYTLRTPTAYPSDAQLLPNGNVLVVGFDTPGRVDELTRTGKIVWTYSPTGYWSLDRPSLAVRWPNGMIAITDDWHHRVVVVDPTTKKVVWSYGHLNRPGSAPGYLSKPDGLDLLPGVVAGVTRTAQHLFGGGQATSANTVFRVDPATGAARTVGHMDEPLSDLGAVVVGGKAYLVGGYTRVRFASAVLRWNDGGKTTTAARLAAGTRYAGVAALGSTIYVAGGLLPSGPSDAVLALGAHGGVHRVATLPAPQDHSALVAFGGRLYLVGGTRVLQIDPSGAVTVAGNLPVALADPAAVAVGNRIAIVGGGTSNVYSFAP